MIQNTTALILHKTIYTEDDFMVKLLTSSGERLDVIAKGARKNNSKRRAHLENISVIAGTVFKGRTHYYLQDLRCEKSFPRLKENFEHIQKAQSLVELILKTVLSDDPMPAVYDLAISTLSGLDQAKAHPFCFYIGLIKLGDVLGFMPNFRECARCHEAILEDKAFWSKESSTLRCHHCAESLDQGFPLKYRKGLEFFRNSPWEQSLKVHLNEEDQMALGSFIENSQFLSQWAETKR